jgi:hypothetical protein
VTGHGTTPRDVGLQSVENTALSRGGIGKPAPVLAEITIRKSQIILGAPAERFRSARQERVQAYQAEAQTEPKIIRVVPVNYASATQLKATLEKLLGACAIIAVDGRTNTLILSGTPSCLRVWEGTR